MRPAKVPYLEGLRGIAAMQVVLLHFVTGFLPNTAQHAWPPLRVLFDGHTAVYVFFLISGAVLTPSFARCHPFCNVTAVTPACVVVGCRKYLPPAGNITGPEK